MSFECEKAWELLTIHLLVSQGRMIRLKLKLLPLLSEPSQIEVCTLLSSACSLEFPHTECVVYRLHVYSTGPYVIQWLVLFYRSFEQNNLQKVMGCSNSIIRLCANLLKD